MSGLALRSPGRFSAAAARLVELWRRAGGPGADSLRDRVVETALALLGPRAELRGGEDGRWLDGYLFSLAGPIYAGTNEIQRNVIAERVLGLPRA